MESWGLLAFLLGAESFWGDWNRDGEVMCCLQRNGAFAIM